jgi:hypothetical protein
MAGQQPTQTVTTYTTNNQGAYTGGNAATYTSVGNTSGQQNVQVGYTSGGYTGTTLLKIQFQPSTTPKSVKLGR